jgi:hypothetical protein
MPTFAWQRKPGARPAECRFTRGASAGDRERGVLGEMCTAGPPPPGSATSCRQPRQSASAGRRGLPRMPSQIADAGGTDPCARGTGSGSGEVGSGAACSRLTRSGSRRDRDKHACEGSLQELLRAGGRIGQPRLSPNASASIVAPVGVKPKLATRVVLIVSGGVGSSWTGSLRGARPRRVRASCRARARP